MSGINNDPRGENREAAPEQKGKKLGELKKKVQKVPLLRRLARNPFLKLLSLVFAIILWAMVMSQTNPDRTKVVYDVPLEIRGLTELNARGLSLATESDELPSTVDVHLEVPMNDLSRATTDNVHATIDLSRITTTGDYSLQVNLTTVYGEATSSSVSSVDVVVESLTTSVVPVQVTTTGTLSENYRLGSIVATPSQFQITGPETDVNRVAAAVVEVDLTNLTADFNRSVVYTLVDENGQAVESANITSTIGNSVSVSIPVYPIKEVPITYESSTTGLLRDGFYLEGIEVAPSTVRIAAPQAVLDEIDSVQVSTIDLEGVSASFTTTLPLKLSGEVVWSSVSEVDVVVRVREEEQTRTFTGLPVTYHNLAAGLQAELYDVTADVSVTMARSALERLTNDDISVYVDLAGYEAMADSAVPVSVSIRANVDYAYELVSEEKVIVRIDAAS